MHSGRRESKRAMRAVPSCGQHIWSCRAQGHREVGAGPGARPAEGPSSLLALGQPQEPSTERCGVYFKRDQESSRAYLRGELNAGRFPILIKRADSIDVSHLYARGWVAFFPYREIGEELGIQLPQRCWRETET